jgi:hypothetical protein
MGPGRAQRAARYVDKARYELGGLAERGVVMSGNAFSSVLLLKGAVEEADRRDGLLAGADGTALRAALQALGYAPEDWAGLSTCGDDGARLDPAVFREAVAALDPATLVVCDAPAADLVREAYADDLTRLESFEEAMLAEGLVVQVAGMRVLALGGFEAALADARQKQVMWRRLKQLPPLGEPY